MRAIRSDFRESQDGRAIVATFELTDVAKEDIHISFQRNKLILTWEIGELHEWEEDGVVFRELIRRVHHRTLPLPEGTRVREGLHHIHSIADPVFQVSRNKGTNDKQRVGTQIPQYALLPCRWALKISRFMSSGR